MYEYIFPLRKQHLDRLRLNTDTNNSNHWVYNLSFIEYDDEDEDNNNMMVKGDKDNCAKTSENISLISPDSSYQTMIEKSDNESTLMSNNYSLNTSSFVYMDPKCLNKPKLLQQTPENQLPLKTNDTKQQSIILPKQNESKPKCNEDNDGIFIDIEIGDDSNRMEMKSKLKQSKSIESKNPKLKVSTTGATTTASTTISLKLYYAFQILFILIFLLLLIFIFILILQQSLLTDNEQHDRIDGPNINDFYYHYYQQQQHPNLPTNYQPFLH